MPSRVSPRNDVWETSTGIPQWWCVTTQVYNLGQNKKEQQTPIPPKSRMKAREGQKHVIFPSLIWGEGGGLGFPFILSKIIVGKIKRNSKPPSPQIKDEGARRAKTRHFPILNLGGRGGLGFPFILSKIVGSASDWLKQIFNQSDALPRSRY